MGSIIFGVGTQVLAPFLCIKKDTNPGNPDTISFAKQNRKD